MRCITFSGTNVQGDQPILARRLNLLSIKKKEIKSGGFCCFSELQGEDKRK